MDTAQMAQEGDAGRLLTKMVAEESSSEDEVIKMRWPLDRIPPPPW